MDTFWQARAAALTAKYSDEHIDHKYKATHAEICESKIRRQLERIGNSIARNSSD